MAMRMSRRQRRQMMEENESIYDLIPTPTKQKARPPMHRSKYPADTPPTASTFGAASASQIPVSNMAGHYQTEADRQAHRHKHAGATLGSKKLHYSDPNQYLKKNKSALPKARKFKYITKIKPDLITRKMASTSPALVRSKQARTKAKKNFVTSNALAAINSEKKNRGDEKMNYLKKSDYGKAPAYLKRVNKEIELETEYIRKVMEQEQQEVINSQPQMRQLPEQERLQLLSDLKDKWAVCNRQYQTMTHHVSLDTIGKIRRKEQYEAQLKQLETSIEKLSRPVVFVQDEL